MRKINWVEIDIQIIIHYLIQGISNGNSTIQGLLAMESTQESTN